MRRRERSSVATKQVSYTWDYYRPNGSFNRAQGPWTGYVQNGDAGVITDTNNGKQRVYNKTTRVDHVRFNVVTHPNKGEKMKVSADGSYFINNNPGAFNLCDPYDFPWGPDSNEEVNAAIEAHNFFAAGCQENKVELLNFIVELPQAIRLIPDAIKLVGKIADLRKLHKNFSDATLSYQFGVLPLISDIKGIIESLSRLDEHVAWLRKNSGKPVRVEFRKSLKATRPADTPISDQANTFYQYTDFRCTYKAHAIIVYDVSSLSDVGLKARTLSRAFGFDNPLLALWNGLPYSFVVDWILDVSSLFERLRIPIILPHTVLDIGQAVRSQMQYNVLFSSRPVSMGNPLSLVQTITKHAYCRVPGLNTSFSSLDLNNPTIKQWLLGALLSLQKL